MCRGSLLRRKDLSLKPEYVLSRSPSPLVVRWLIDRVAEEVAQFLVDQVHVGIEIFCQHMVCSVAVGFAALFEMAGLEKQLAILNAHPDVPARVAITPLEQQTTLVLIKAPLTVEEIAIKHLQ